MSSKAPTYAPDYETCQTCVGNGRLDDEHAPWWKFWAWGKCPDCHGSGMVSAWPTRPVTPDMAHHADLVNHGFDWKFVVIGRDEYTHLLKLVERVERLEALARKPSVWERLRRYHKRICHLEQIEGRVNKLERTNKPTPLFKD